MQSETTRLLGLTTLLLALIAWPGCKDQGPSQSGTAANAGGGQGGEGATPGGDQQAQGEEGGDKEGGGEESDAPPKEEPETEDEKHPAHTHRDQTFRLVIKATFTDVPAGARIIAPSARDRRYQKVTRSDHKGMPGAVMVAEDGENLFFVSDAIKGKTAELTYKGLFAITRRVGTQGDLATAKGAAWEGEDGKVSEASTAAPLTAFASSMGAENGKPYAELQGSLAKVKTLKRANDGSADPAVIVGGEVATPRGVARTLVEVSRLRGVPARLVQGLHQPKVRGTVQSTHHWIDAKLPRLSWVPLDPVLNADSDPADGPGAFLGLLPADRVTMVVGDDITLPEDGTFPRTTLSGDLAAPFAILDGKRVGTATWTATFEASQAPAKE